MEPKLFDAQEFSTLAGVPRGTLRRWKHEGKLIPAIVNAGNKGNYYDESQIDLAVKLFQMASKTRRENSSMNNLFSSEEDIKNMETSQNPTFDNHNDDREEEIPAVIPTDDDDDDAGDDELIDPPIINDTEEETLSDDVSTSDTEFVAEDNQLPADDTPVESTQVESTEDNKFDASGEKHEDGEKIIATDRGDKKDIAEQNNHAQNTTSHTIRQCLNNLPAELLSQPRFFALYGKQKKDTPKGWSNPDNQRLFSELDSNCLLGFDTCGHDRADDYLLIDFDHVLDDNGEFVSDKAKDWYNTIKSKFGDCYCELSISGHGLHFIGKPTIGKFNAIANGKNGVLLFDKDNDVKIELFYKTKARYCLMTGNCYECDAQAPIPQGAIVDEVFQELLDAIAKQNLVEETPKKERAEKATRNAEPLYTSSDSTEYDSWRVNQMVAKIPVADLSGTKWLSAITALKNLGFSYSEVDRLNQGGAHYDESENRRRWDSAEPWSKDTAIGTLYNLAVEYGYDPQAAYHEFCQLHPEFQTKVIRKPQFNEDGELMTTDNRVRTRDKIKDCPADLLVPPDFILNNRGVTFVKPATERKPEVYIPAIKTPVIVTKVLSGQSDGKRRYEIAIKSRGKWIFQEVEAKTLQSPRQIYDLAEYGCLIADAGLATRYFTSFIADNERDISELKIYSKPGWYDDGKKFIYPTPHENADYRVERNNIEYSTMFTTRGDREQWIEKFRNVTNRSPIHAIYFGAALAAPLLDVLGLPNFWFHLNGCRNLCKTPLMKFALSTFGNPEKIMRTFNASPKHLQTMAVGLNDLPLGIDEGETMTEKALAEFQTTIYNFVAGVDGQRNQRNGDVRVTEDFRGVRISTSEQPLLRTSNKGGAYKRFIDLHVSEPLFSVTEGRELHLFCPRNHGHFGRLWIEYISAHADEIRADFDWVSNELAERHGEKYETTHMLDLAACATAFWHFRLFLKLDSHFERDLARYYANQVLEQLPTQDEIDDVKRWLELLEGYVASHPKHFWRKVILPDGTIPTENFYAPTLFGRVLDDDSVAIIASVFKSICEELSIPAEKFLNELFERDYLVDATRKNKAKQARVGGNKTRAYVFKAGTLWHSEVRRDADSSTITN